MRPAVIAGQVATRKWELKMIRTTLATAIDNILAVPVPPEPPRVELDVKTYLFVDPALESLTPAEKHVLRLGPQNAREVQSKLRDLRDGLVAVGAIPRR